MKERYMKTIESYITPLSEERLLKCCAKIKHVALDMDGTIYLGSTLFPYTQGFLQGSWYLVFFPDQQPNQEQ